MRIFISGASGFVGSNLITELRNNFDDVKTISYRIENDNLLFPSEADVFIHLAGKAHDTSNLSGAEDYFRVNRDLTIKVFDLFLQSECRDFFFFSSVKAAADSVEGVLGEEIVCNPQTPYGKSKFEAEQYILSKALPKGKRVFIIRPCMIHGPGNKGNLNLLYKVVEKGVPWPLATYNNKRSFLSISNLSYLVINMIKSLDVKSGIYNFSDDKPLSTNELVKLISVTRNRKAKLWFLPKFFIVFLSSMGDIFRLPLNSERLKKLTENYEVSNDKIKNELGIKVLPLSVEEGMRKTIDSFSIK